MSLSEARFHDLVDATQQAIEDVLDDCDLDIDLENSAGVLTVRFENGSQLIFSRQEPLRQLWVAARSGGFHFDYDAESQRWLCDSNDEPLGELLLRVTAEQAGEVCSNIRAAIRGLYGARVARSVTIQYGGSMNPKNVAGLMAQSEIDGGLIGGASLKAEDFSKVVNY